MSKLSKQLLDDYAALLAEVKERIRPAQYETLKRSTRNWSCFTGTSAS